MSRSVVFSWVLAALLVGLGATAFTWNRGSVFFGGAVYFSDGDCYARMTRVRALAAHPFQPVGHHSFENFPIGTDPHTTAPLDYMILFLAGVLRPFSVDSLSLAGALVSPILGVATLILLAFGMVGSPFRSAVLLLVAVSPMTVHGFELGRPDHQSLLIFLVTAAWICEFGNWRGRSVAGALAWGLALWVSLFEPLVLLLVVLAVRLVSGRLAVRWAPLGVFLVVCVARAVVDGLPTVSVDPHFGNWARTIGELRPAPFGLVLGWCGWLVIVSPFILLYRFWKGRDPAVLMAVCLLGVLLGLTAVHARWGYFLVVAFALSLPFVLVTVRLRWVGWVVFLVSLWPVAEAWDEVLYPEPAALQVRGEAVADAVALRDAALQLKGQPPGGVVAPWWFSPAVVWWSGQPAVAGTSHQSLPGITDTAEFFLSDGDGREILKRRAAKYVIAYDAGRVIGNSEQVLGRSAGRHPLAVRLYNEPHSAPFRVIYANRFFKVFEDAQ